MKRCLIGLTLLLFAAVDIAGAEKIEPQKIEGKIDWVYNYAQAQKLAKKNGKPLFVVIRCER